MAHGPGQRGSVGRRDGNDGGSQFAADAALPQIAGLAHSTLSSSQS
ncbi:hypothetical protein ACWCRD_43810 [Streptomyces sp. NPDC002092]